MSKANCIAKLCLRGVKSDDITGVDWTRRRVLSPGVSPVRYENGTASETSLAFAGAAMNCCGEWPFFCVDYSVTDNHRLRLQAQDNTCNRATGSEITTADIQVE